MNNPESPRARCIRRYPTGFSLIELLSVVAVVLTLAALAIPGISSTLSALRITNATRTIIDEIQVARTTALSQNAPVEVWFLQEGEEFTTIRSLILNPDNTTTWTSRPRRLPEGTALAPDATHSNIIGAQSLSHPENTSSGPQGVCIRIFPSGKLEVGDTQSLGSNDPHYLTIIPRSALESGDDATLPPNFATIQINPVNSRITTHRP